MSDSEDILKFTEELIHCETRHHLSDVERAILTTVLEGSRKTYEEIAKECGYSPKYVRQHIASNLWQSLSQALNQKITKFNAKAILEHVATHQETIDQAALSMTSSMLPSPLTSANKEENILLVDDEPENLTLLSDMLEEQGYEVQQAINGTIALQAISLTLPDLILLDICMPDMDGYTLCQKLKADSKTQAIPVIFVSALDESWDKVKAFSMGGGDYITKPYKVIEVLARVENQLKIKRLQQALIEKDLQLQEALQKLEIITEKYESATSVNTRTSAPQLRTEGEEHRVV